MSDKAPSGIGCFVLAAPPLLFALGSFYMGANQQGALIALGAGVVAAGLVGLGVGFRASQKQADAKWKYSRGGAVVGAAVVLALVGFLYARLSMLDSAARAEYAAREVVTKRAFTLCKSGPGLPETAAYGTGPHPMMVFIQLSGESTPYEVAGPAMAAKGLEDLQLVACLKVTKRSIESCSYEGKNGARQVDRVQYTEDVRLFESRTGKLVAETSVEGEPPGPCPDVKTFGSSRDPNVSGGYPDEKHPEVAAFLRAHFE